MNREVHVRFFEGLRVQLPWATHLRTLADSGVLIIWGCLQGREFTPGCRSVSLSR
jgi:hypothetical protein